MPNTVRIRKPSRYMGIGCLVAGAVFLFDPFIAVFDLLPDALGYLLIAIGLYRFSDMDDRLAEVSRAAMKLSLVGLVRWIALILTFGLVSYNERPVFMLLAVFVLAVVDLLMLLPMWKNFSGGILYLGSRADATAVFDRSRIGGRLHRRSLCERYVSFTILYFVLREVLAVLPELTVLTHERGGADGSVQSLYNFIGLFRMLGILISLILGMIWLVKTIVFVHKLKRDRLFFEALHRKYAAEVAPRQDLFAMRAVKASLVSLGAAAVLSMDFFVEGVSLLPDFLAAGAMILAVILLRRYTNLSKLLPALICAALYAVTSTATWLMQLLYLNIRDIKELNNVLDKPILEERLAVVTKVHMLNSLLFFVTFLFILRLLFDLVRRHTGLRALREGSTYAEGRNQAIHARIRRKLIWVGVFAAFSAISALILWGYVPRLEAIDYPFRPEAGDAFLMMVYDFLRQAYWSVDLIIGGGLVAVTVHAGNEIFEQMDYSYLMN